MPSDVEKKLLEVLTRGSEAGEDRWLRMGAVEALVAELFGGRRPVNLSKDVRTPDVLISGDNRQPVLLELKLTRQRDAVQGLRAMTASLLAAAVELRRSYREEVTLVAVILPVPEGDVGVNWSLAENVSARRLFEAVARLMRSDDGVGFDTVLVGDVRQVEEPNRGDGGDARGQALEWRRFAVGQDLQGVAELPPPMATEEAVASLMAQTTPVDAPTEVDSAERLRRVLLVADEWRSGRGGISTINRELAVALVSVGADVCVFVPHIEDEDLQSASESGVTLVTSTRVPGLSEREMMMLKPVLADDGWQPDYILGHGRLLGPYAFAQKHQFFPTARRVHIVHTAAEELEAAKETLGGESRMGTADPRRLLERELARSADLVLGVGPLLTERISDELLGAGEHTRVDSLDPGLGAQRIVDPDRVPTGCDVLFIGRADDFHSKGIDIVAAALLDVVDRWPSDQHYMPTLTVRGVPAGEESSVKAQLDEIVNKRFNFHLRPYSESPEEMGYDLAKARVVVMPSRHEGFGLAAFEAIGAGVPVLISAQSGLARFLGRERIDTSPSSVVTTVDTATAFAVNLWADALRDVLLNPEKARRNAAELREQVEASVSWPESAARLLASLR